MLRTLSITHGLLNQCSLIQVGFRRTRGKTNLSLSYHPLLPDPLSILTLHHRGMNSSLSIAPLGSSYICSKFTRNSSWRLSLSPFSRLLILSMDHPTIIACGGDSLDIQLSSLRIFVLQNSRWLSGPPPSDLPWHFARRMLTYS